MDRAYSLLSVKSIAPATRTFAGIASTPELDRQGHVVDPSGATFRNPLPLLLHHDTQQPVGTVVLTAMPDGLRFEATLPQIDRPGRLKDRVDEAWDSITAGVLTGVSIGYRLIDNAVERLKSGGLRLLKTEIFELSLVTIPANAQASILSVKSLCKEPAMTQTTAERISALEGKRGLLVKQLDDLQQSVPADGTMEPAERETLTRVTTDIKTLDGDIAAWREMQELQVKSATPVSGFSPYGRVSVTPNVPQGTAFVRYVCAQVAARKAGVDPAAWAAARWNDSTPEVALALKAAVAPGTATDATWAGPLVQTNISNDFIELLRAATIIDKITGFNTVPFNTKVPAQTGGGTFNWVGEMKPKPVTAMAFSSVTLDWAKVAGITVLTMELIKLSSPKAEDVVRRSMVKDIAAFIDGQFVNPAVAAVAGVSPASITNGAPTAAATTNPLADILLLIQHFVNNNLPVAGVHFLMSPTNALALSFKTNADGSAVFPGITAEGGSYKGLKFITSQTVGSLVIALQPEAILYADDGGVTIDASGEASLQMDSAPDSPVAATTVYVSMFQMNTVALRAERFINWKKSNANAVKYLTAAAYPAPALAAAGK